MGNRRILSPQRMQGPILALVSSQRIPSCVSSNSPPSLGAHYMFSKIMMKLIEYVESFHISVDDGLPLLTEHAR